MALGRYLLNQGWIQTKFGFRPKKGWGKFLCRLPFCFFWNWLIPQYHFNSHLTIPDIPVTATNDATAPSCSGERGREHPYIHSKYLRALAQLLPTWMRWWASCTSCKAHAWGLSKGSEPQHPQGPLWPPQPGVWWLPNALFIIPTSLLHPLKAASPLKMDHECMIHHVWKCLKPPTLCCSCVWLPYCHSTT